MHIFYASVEIVEDACQITSVCGGKTLKKRVFAVVLQLTLFLIKEHFPLANLQRGVQRQI